MLSTSRQGLEVRVRQPGWARYEWMALTVMVAAGLALALWGGKGSAWARTSDGLELLYPHFPPAAEPGTSWQMMTARVLLPVVALYATLRFVVSFYTQRLRLFRLRRLAGHSVVCGLSEAGRRAALALAEAGRQVVVVDEDGLGRPAAEAVAAGASVLVGDPMSAGVLDAAAVRRARRVVCTLPREEDNLRLALSIRSDMDGPVIQARIARPALVDLATSAGVECFDLDDIWAGNLLAAGPLARPSPDHAPTLMVIGTGTLARSLVVQATRLWHFFAREQGVTDRLRIAVIGPDADRFCEGLRAALPALGRTSVLEAAPRTPTARDLTALIQQSAPECVYVCLAEEALGVAHSAARAVAGTADVVVAVSGPGMAAAGVGVTAVAAGGPSDTLLFERFGVREELARALHGVYVNATVGHSGRTAVTPFDNLTAGQQQGNREQADAISRQLTAVLWHTTGIADWDDLAELPTQDVEVVAQLEHLRWATAYTAAGWRYGPLRDEPGRLHPDLVPWAALSEESREINRAFVRARPALLGRVGRALEPDPAREGLAYAFHRRYLSDVAGEVQAPAWSAVSEGDRRASLGLVAALPSALLSIDRVIAASPAVTAPLEDAHVEFLAEAIHASWTNSRAESGWRYGEERDDTARTHPDMLSWDDLREQRREIDRTLVRATPVLLAEMGLGITALDVSCWTATHTVEPRMRA
jgi:hypothetical protein